MGAEYRMSLGKLPFPNNYWNFYLWCNFSNIHVNPLESKKDIEKKGSPSSKNSTSFSRRARENVISFWLTKKSQKNWPAKFGHIRFKYCWNKYKRGSSATPGYLFISELIQNESVFVRKSLYLQERQKKHSTSLI